jgi:hypothetical protein
MVSNEWTNAKREITEIVDAIPFNHEDPYALCLRVIGNRLITLGEDMDGFDIKAASNQDRASHEVDYLQFTQLFSSFAQVSAYLYHAGKLPATLAHRFKDGRYQA